jgi:hypothetical protein
MKKRRNQKHLVEDMKMSRVSKFCGEVVSVDIRGEKFNIHPIGTDEYYLFEDIGKKDGNERDIARCKLIKSSLKDEKDLTIEELQKMTAGIKSRFIEHILITNNFDEELEDAKEKFIAESRKTHK